MTEQSISDKIRNYISVLDFISTIPKGHKPCYKTKTTIPKDSWFVTIKRRWNGEKGEYGVEYITEILNDCEYILNEIRDSEDISELARSLSKSLKGFDKLIETYNDQKGVENSYKECKEIVEKLLININEAENKKNSIKTVKSFFNTTNVRFITGVSKKD